MKKVEMRNGKYEIYCRENDKEALEGMIEAIKNGITFTVVNNHESTVYGWGMDKWLLKSLQRTGCWIECTRHDRYEGFESEWLITPGAGERRSYEVPDCEHEGDKRAAIIELEKLGAKVIDTYDEHYDEELHCTINILVRKADADIFEEMGAY